MERLAIHELLKWKDKQYRKPLIIEGARQVGKTWLVKEFARQNYKQLAFLDEIQAAPHAVTSLKYFAENAPGYHVIAAGSLLGIELHQGESFPVGKVDFLSLSVSNELYRVCDGYGGEESGAAASDEGLEYDNDVCPQVSGTLKVLLLRGRHA